MQTVGRILFVKVILFSFTAIVPAAFAQTTLHVENNGVDSADCGTSTAPCRSISRAISNASEGDTIVVGRGRYGDLNGNGTVEPGEEAAEVGFGSDCLIKINKLITVKSRDGARVTMIDRGLMTVAHGVRIQVSGAVFGGTRKGFMVNRHVTIDNNTSGVTVVGNILPQSSGDAVMLVCGSSNTVTGNEAMLFDIGGDGHRISENIGGNGNSPGFVINGTGHLITRNLATNTPDGFVVNGSGHTIAENTSAAHSLAFGINGTGHTIRGNVVGSGGGNGFELQGANHSLTENTITAIGSTALYVISGSGHEIRRNAVVGNAGYGIATLVSDITITENNIFGNGSNGGNCGLLNLSGGALLAQGNFGVRRAGQDLIQPMKSVIFLVRQSLTP